MIRPFRYVLIAVLVLVPALVDAQITPFRPPITQASALTGESVTIDSMLNDAAGENAAMACKLELQAGSGTKTLSAAGGGSITVYMYAVTWATASSEYRVGIEDLDGATGLLDGTQDVYGAKVAGTNAITANAYNTFTMTSGTTTRSHGDWLAVSGRMPVRAGADALNLGSFVLYPLSTTSTNATMTHPYGIANSAKIAEMLWAVITFDDGTYGWCGGTSMIVQKAVTQVTINTGTTPDELVGGFTVASPVQASFIGVMVDNVASGDNFEVCLYADPFGTISTIECVSYTVAARTDLASQVRTVYADITPVTLNATQTGGYGISLRPTTGNSISYTYEDLGSGFGFLKATIPFFRSAKVGSRVDNTGAFTETQTYHAPLIFIGISGLPSSTSGGEHSSAH